MSRQLLSALLVKNAATLSRLLNPYTREFRPSPVRTLIRPDGSRDKVFKQVAVPVAERPPLQRALERAAGVKANDQFGDKPIGNTIAALGFQGVRPLRLTRNALALTSAGSGAYAAHDSYEGAKERLRTIGDGMSLATPEQRAAVSRMGAAVAKSPAAHFLPDFLTDRTPQEQLDAQLVRRLTVAALRDKFSRAKTNESLPTTAYLSPWDYITKKTTQLGLPALERALGEQLGQSVPRAIDDYVRESAKLPDRFRKSELASELAGGTRQLGQSLRDDPRLQAGLAAAGLALSR